MKIIDGKIHNSSKDASDSVCGFATGDGGTTAWKLRHPRDIPPDDCRPMRLSAFVDHDEDTVLDQRSNLGCGFLTGEIGGCFFQNDVHHGFIVLIQL